MKSRISLISILAILSFSTFIPALAYAAPTANSAKDWQYINGNSWAWNYSPQTQITTENVDQLEVKWVFPISSRSSRYNVLPASILGEGAIAPPIVRGGNAYVSTSYFRTYAIDAKTGAELWRFDYTIDVEELEERLPVVSFGAGHLHGFRYWEGGDAILVAGYACDFYGIDAKTGEEKFWAKDLCLNVPGNIYDYRVSNRGTSNQNNIGTYDKGRQFTYVLSGSAGSRVFYGDSRHLMMGVDMDTLQILWRVFGYPPQDKLTKDWALQECDIGWFQTYPCTEVAAQNRAGLEWDWAFPNEKPSPFGGVSANWGQPVIDEDTGILYTNTGNQEPYTNVSLTPGPRLYGTTIMAIDMDEGKRIWWLQTSPHDLLDYDCNWSGILAEVPGLGKVYTKGCKEGRLYVMEAATGRPIYVKDVIDEQIEWGQITPAGGIEIPNGVKYHLVDPFSYSDLREWKGMTDGMYCSEECTVYPHWSNGLFATDMSYDPESQTLYHYATAIQVTVITDLPLVEGGRLTLTRGNPITNTTIVARDLATGDVKWTWYYDLSQQRSHMVVTPSVLFTGFKEGYIKFFNKDTGELLRDMNLGAAMLSGPTTGQDSDGNQKIFTMVGLGGSAFGPSTPGTLVALGLTEIEGQATVTTTTVSRTTVTVAGSTETVGLPAEYTYAAAAVAVIAIIAAAVLATRRR